MADLPDRAEDLGPFLDNLQFTDEPTAAPPPPADTTTVMVVRSLRLPLDLDQRLKTAAAARGVPTSTLVRDWIELELTALDNDQPISRADALRALATLRPLGPAA
jgi:predicted DNA-binding protein